LYIVMPGEGLASRLLRASKDVDDGAKPRNNVEILPVPGSDFNRTAVPTRATMTECNSQRVLIQLHFMSGTAQQWRSTGHCWCQRIGKFVPAVSKEVGTAKHAEHANGYRLRPDNTPCAGDWVP
jgi:hypothetical protein